MLAADTLLGLLSVAGGLLVTLAGLRIAGPSGEPGLPPGAFPILLGLLLVILGACLAWRGQRGAGSSAPGGRTARQVRESVASPRSLALCGLVLGYFLTFRMLDFRLGSWLFVLAAMWTLGARKTGELLLLPVAVSGSLYLLFRYGFTVLLPTWG